MFQWLMIKILRGNNSGFVQVFQTTTSDLLENAGAQRPCSDGVHTDSALIVMDLHS